MAITFPTASRALALQNITNKTASAVNILHLYKNSHTFSNSTTAASLTECDATSYAAITLTAANWTVSGDTISFPTSTFTIGSAQTIYGWYCTSGGALLYGETLSSSLPFGAGGGNLLITPTITCS